MTNLHNREALRKLYLQLEILSCLGYAPKSFNVQGYDAQAKTTAFFQLTLLSNNPVLTSYLSGIYLKSWFSWLRGGVQKTLKKSNWIFQIIIEYYKWIFLISFVLSLVVFFVFVFSVVVVVVVVLELETTEG